MVLLFIFYYSSEARVAADHVCMGPALSCEAVPHLGTSFALDLWAASCPCAVAHKMPSLMLQPLLLCNTGEMVVNHSLETPSKHSGDGNSLGYYVQLNSK